MGKSGYTSLSLDENRYATLRKDWDKIVGKNTEDTFTAWATTVLEQAIQRTSLIDSMFPTLIWVGKTDTGCVIKDKSVIVEVKWNKNKLVCSVDKDLCSHCIFAALNSKF
jgi:mRNA-degrading endonuclease HigB of HigAB toxin-antitoxin module